MMGCRAVAMATCMLDQKGNFFSPVYSQMSWFCHHLHLNKNIHVCASTLLLNNSFKILLSVLNTKKHHNKPQIQDPDDGCMWTER